MFSLIIPYHNRASFLPRTLRSLLACTVKPARTILVDNGSTDGSVQICEAFASAHPELSVLLLSESRKGACAARNKGLDYVETEWVYFFDSDDELSSTYFEKIGQIVALHPHVDLVACATCMVFSDQREVIRSVQYSSSPVDQILSGQLSTQGMFLRTDFLRSIGKWNENLPVWNDWELGLRLLVGGARMVWLKDNAWHRIYQHSASLTGNNFSEKATDVLQALQAAEQIVSGNSQLIAALAFRYVWLSAVLFREGNHMMATVFLQNANRLSANLSFYQRFVIRYLLYYYVRLGGRGGWMIARRLLF